MINIEKLKRRLERLNKRLEPIAIKHHGNEMNYTYWGGHELGYLKGKIAELENIIDECSDDEDIESETTTDQLCTSVTEIDINAIINMDTVESDIKSPIDITTDVKGNNRPYSEFMTFRDRLDSGSGSGKV